ncbi:MAG: hypothetical protein R6T98_08445 [Desulfatiglandales bacterium]
MSLVPTFCGRYYGLNVVPLSPAVRKGNRQNKVVLRACPRISIGITDIHLFSFLYLLTPLPTIALHKNGGKISQMDSGQALIKNRENKDQKEIRHLHYLYKNR